MESFGIDVVICSVWSRGEDLKRCLCALSADPEAGQFNVVVVLEFLDDYAKCGLEGLGFVSAFKTFRVLPVRGMSPVEAANYGFRMGNSPFVTFLSDDSIACGNCIGYALRGFSKKFGVVPLLGALKYYEGDGDWFWMMNLGLYYATNFVVSRRYGEQLGWYDERYYAHYSDPDFSMRAADAGFSLWLVGQPGVIHCRASDEFYSVVLKKHREDEGKFNLRWKDKIERGELQWAEIIR